MNTQQDGMNGDRPGSRYNKASSADVRPARAGRKNRASASLRRQRKSRSGRPSTTQQQYSYVTAVDFHALGLNPHECRLTVIRKAAALICRTLAERQLLSPSPRNNLKLWRAAFSTYRLMDPRKRSDPNQSAYVGRIMPLALMSAGRTQFAVGFPLQTDRIVSPDGVAVASELNDQQEFALLSHQPQYVEPQYSQPLVPLDAATVQLSHGMELDNGLTKTLRSDDLLHPTFFRRSYQRLRWTNPWVKLSMAAAVLLIAFAGYRKLSTNSSTTLVAESQETVAPAQETTTPATTTSNRLDAAEKNVSQKNTLRTSVTQPAVNPSDSNEPLPSTREAASETGHGNQNKFDPQLANETPKSVSPKLFAETMPTDETIPTQTASTEDVPSDLIAGAIETDSPLLKEISPEPNELPSEPLAGAGEMPTATEPDPQPTTLDDPFANLAEVSIVQAPLEVKERSSIPEPDVIARIEQDLTRVLTAFQQPLKASQIPPVMASLSDLQNVSAPDSPQSWVIRNLAARTTWLTGSVEAAHRSLAPLSPAFDCQLDDVLADSFVQATPFIETVEAHNHRTEQGLRLLDHLMLAEEFDLATSVKQEIEKSVDFTDDEQKRKTLRDFQLATEKMQRLQETATKVAQHSVDATDTVNEEKNGISSSEAGIAGRYFCLMQRRWQQGLSWMAVGSDARLASLAKQELLLTDSSTADDRISIAKRWLAASQRGSGRESESMLLHSLTLLRSALDGTDGVKEIELERTIIDVQSKLPWYLTHPVELDELPTDNPSIAEVSDTSEDLEPTVEQERTIQPESQADKPNDQKLNPLPSIKADPDAREIFDPADVEMHRRISKLHR